MWIKRLNRIHIRFLSFYPRNNTCAGIHSSNAFIVRIHRTTFYRSVRYTIATIAWIPIPRGYITRTGWTGWIAFNNTNGSSPRRWKYNCVCWSKPAHIIEGSRIRKQSGRRAVYLAHLDHLDGGTSEMKAAFNSLNKAAIPYREHQSKQPPPPESWKEMLIHPKAIEFLEAVNKEWEVVKAKDTVPMPKDADYYHLNGFLFTNSMTTDILYAVKLEFAHETICKSRGQYTSNYPCCTCVSCSDGPCRCVWLRNVSFR